RVIRKKPGLVLAAVLCLALGLGANITIFSLFNAVLLKPLSGVAEPYQLAVMLGAREGGGFDLISYPDYIDYRDRNRVFSGLLAYRSVSMNLSSSDYPERLYGAMVSGNYFSVLGVEAALGRTFRPEEDMFPGTHPVAVISHRLWQRKFNADPEICGRTISLNSHRFTVIGVAPADFKGTETGELFDLWVPLMMHAQARPQQDEAPADMLGLRDKDWLILIGRIKQGVVFAQAEAEMELITSQLKQTYPKESVKRAGIKLSPHVGLGPVDYIEAGRFLLMVMALAGLVLLIACANVANLLLVRAAARRKEVAVRLALGATRLRIIRQFLTESLLIAMLGTALGFLIMYSASDWLASLFAQALTPGSLDFSLDHRAVLFAVTLSLVTVLLFGLAPALQASNPDLVPELKESLAFAGRRRRRLSSLFVVAQIAISLVLLVGAGLMVRTLQKVYSVEPGFVTENMLTLSLDLKLLGRTEEQGRQFYKDLMERTSATPGVKAAGLASILPLGWASNPHEVFIDGQGLQSDGRPLTVDYNVVTPGYFQLMGTPLVAGRDFAVIDGAEAAGVVIINEAMARRFWPEQNPVGKSFEIGGRFRRAVEIIGLANNSKFSNLQEEFRPIIYLPLMQNYESYMTLHLRTAVEPMSMVAAVRREVQQIDPNLPFIEIKTLEQRMDESVWPQRTMSTLIISFGLLALFLAALGLYGVLSYTVAERTHEIGIRRALGAQAGDVLRLVMKEGLRLVLAGCAIGIPVAFALTRLMANFLYGVSARDPLTFTLITVLLSIIALTACYIPARRAMKVDPMVALRHE
ncbi:MAG: ABC transporter permease, partial [Blastocatellia bacterium]|nr:ABC transporter permease [Blastocatellia bacterium]